MFATQLTGESYELRSVTETDLDGIIACGLRANVWDVVKAPDVDLDTHVRQYVLALWKDHQQGASFAYVIRKIDTGEIVGSTRYYDVSPENKRLAIGYTWYHHSYWGSGINGDVKNLLLRQVFDDLGWNRVEFHVDARNGRSQAAMNKIGAVKEGVLRQHKIVQGDYVRDTVVFSIVKPDGL
ncbi:MAG: GNAT family protein [bacterium]|nr:GNAT family protein [bacterium]